MKRVDKAVFIAGCSDGRVVRVAGEFVMLSRNYETTTERLATIAQCNSPIVKVLIDETYKLVLVITEDNTLKEYTIEDEACKTLTEIVTVRRGFKTLI